MPVAVTYPQVLEETKSAIQGLIGKLQARLGITSGDFAAQYFTGQQKTDLTEWTGIIAGMMVDYVHAEQMAACRAGGWDYVRDSDVIEQWCGERQGVVHVDTLAGRDNFSDSVYGGFAACYAENFMPD